MCSLTSNNLSDIDYQPNSILDYNYSDESRSEHATKRTFQAVWKSKQPPRVQPSRESFGPRDISPCPAKAVSFREDSTLSSSYNESCSISYYDQCFETISKIGEGSFGKVFKARCKDDGQFYAVKITKVRFVHKWDRINKIKEVRRHEKIPKHPNCVELIFSWEEHDYLYIQLELCETSLETFTRANVITEESVWRVLMDLLLAVKHIHDLNVIHLDIKLENIFIAATGRCKLGDFGIAVDITQGPPTDSLDGDSKYLAPEVLRNVFSKAADVFSLGVVALELATDLVVPRRGPLWHELRHDTWPTHLFRGLSADMVVVITSTMTSDPDLRPSVDRVLSLPRLSSLAATVSPLDPHPAFQLLLGSAPSTPLRSHNLSLPSTNHNRSLRCTPPCPHRSLSADPTASDRSIVGSVRPICYEDESEVMDESTDEGFANDADKCLLSPIMSPDAGLASPDAGPTRLRIINSTPQLGKTVKMVNGGEGSWGGNGRRLFD